MGKLKIYCPKCGREIFKSDEDVRSYMELKCTRCNKLVTYDADRKRTVAKDIPKRNTSSGMRFW